MYLTKIQIFNIIKLIKDIRGYVMKKSIFKAALIFCMILCLALSLAVFTACTVGQKDTGEDTSGITSGDSDSEGNNTGDNDGGDTSGDSDNTGDNTGDETGDNTGDNTGDDMGTPPAEITEEQYAVMCKEKLNEIALNALNESDEFGTISNVEIITINKKSGVIYALADRTVASPVKFFYTVNLKQEFQVYQTNEETFNNLNEIEFENPEIKTETILSDKISEELFDEFCDYIKRQSYTYGDEVIDFSAIDPQNLEIINVTNTIRSGGRKGFDFKIIDKANCLIYSGKIRGYTMKSAVDDQIIELMGKTTNTFKITEISEFQEFELSA